MKSAELKEHNYQFKQKLKKENKKLKERQLKTV